MAPDAITSVNAKLVPFAAGAIGIWIGIMLSAICMTEKGSDVLGSCNVMLCSFSSSSQSLDNTAGEGSCTSHALHLHQVV